MSVGFHYHNPPSAKVPLIQYSNIGTVNPNHGNILWSLEPIGEDDALLCRSLIEDTPSSGSSFLDNDEIKT